MSPRAAHGPKDRAEVGLWRTLTPADKLLVAALLVLSASSFVAVPRVRPVGQTVVVRAGREEVYRGPLSQNRHLAVRGPGGLTVVEIRDGAAWVSTSECPLHICVRMGRISRAGEVAVCVPNRVVVQIEGHRRNRFDVIVG